MYTAGIDIGSSNIKAAIWDGSSFEVWSQPTGWDISETSEAVIQVLLDRASLKMEDLHQIVATGYGRKMCRFSGRSVTEITCHAAGAFYLTEGAETVLDIGGQDVKVIRLDIEGKVTDFLMNDKCAAGTGRFLEIMAHALGYTLEEFPKAALSAGRFEKINSMCTVFAESEVISLTAKGAARSEVALGIHRAIVSRSTALLRRIAPSGEVFFAGGVALNGCVETLLAEELARPVVVPPDPQSVGALGAAIHAASARPRRESAEEGSGRHANSERSV